MMRTLLRISLAGIVGGLLFELVPFSLYPHHDFWMASPEFFFVRFGLVGLTCAATWWYEQHHTPSSRSVFSLFGQESLLVYVVHLLIVYGHTYDWSFIRTFGETLGYVECLGLTIGLIVAMFVMASVWHWFKGKHRTMASWVQVIVIAAVIVQFILR
jgi:hypothetical protein